MVLITKQKSYQEKINSYKQVLLDLVKSSDNEGKEIMIQLVRTLIRNEEIGQMRKYYFHSRCYFGFLLIQSQVYELNVRNIISSCEQILNTSKETSRLGKINLDEIPLGPLITRFEHYFEYPALFELLKNFNSFRKKVIHQLVDPTNTSLEVLENEIWTKYHDNEFAKIETMLQETSRRTNLRFSSLNGTENDPYIKQINLALSKLTNLSKEQIEFKF